VSSGSFVQTAEHLTGLYEVFEALEGSKAKAKRFRDSCIAFCRCVEGKVAVA
jgi:hypothetical protein